MLSKTCKFLLIQLISILSCEILDSSQLLKSAVRFPTRHCFWMVLD